MTLTVKEKEHWKERISRKINQAIDALCAEHDPGFRERIRMTCPPAGYRVVGDRRVAIAIGRNQEHQGGP